MPLTRRVALLAWASTADATVLEDARCDDLLVTPAATCLHGLDDEARVVQLGGFGALFHPGIHLAYAVLPRPRVAPFAAAVAALDPGATPVQQRALGRFVVDGHFERQLVRVRRTLAERLDAAIDALRRELGWLVSVDAPAAAPGWSRRSRTTGSRPSMPPAPLNVSACSSNRSIATGSPRPATVSWFSTSRAWRRPTSAPPSGSWRGPWRTSTGGCVRLGRSDGTAARHPSRVGGRR